MIDTIVFSSGGIRGLSFIGVLKALEEYRIINNVNTLAGTSIGAIIATMIALGYNSTELYDFIINFDYTELKDIQLSSFLESFGLESGKKLEKFFQAMIKIKMGKGTLNFQELYKITGKRLIITATCLNNRKVVYFDHLEHPHMPIYKALRMSISIPFLFAAVKYRKKYYVDGAILDSFPIQLFSDKKENQVLGIQFEQTVNNDNIQITDLESFIFNLWGSIQNVVNSHKEPFIDKFKIVHLRIPSMKAFDFYPDLKQRQNYHQIGYQSTKDSLESYRIVSDILSDVLAELMAKFKSDEK
jgi:predicted acylesterase/phospholipase RssA